MMYCIYWISILWIAFKGFV